MTCCMNINMNTNLLINNFMEKKKTFTVWLKKRLPTKLNDKETVTLEESKYIKKIECKIPKAHMDIEGNFKYDHFNDDLTSKSKCLIDPNEKIESRCNDQTEKTVAEKDAKFSKAKNQYKSLNQDEWELFFVIDDDKVKFNQHSDKKSNKAKVDLNKKEDLDLEWDDFNDDFNDDFDDELNLVCSEGNQLIFEKKISK